MKIALVAMAVLATTFTALPSAASEGKDVYTKSCAMCHKAMSPKTGDKAAWEPRLKLGKDALVAAVVKGKGTMPAKGGHPELSEADIKDAVEYMIDQVK